jgi:hypothetical protein
MLYEETVGSSTLELLTSLMNDSYLVDFVLVGGTAIALQIGHRISVDLDLFSNHSFDENILVDYLRSQYYFQLDFQSKNTLKGEINEVQIDCIAHQYPWVEPFVVYGNIRLAGFADLAAMKLNAISGNGTRIKDFIDIAFLSGKLSLNQMLEGYQKKYNSNPIIAIKALTWFEDINFSEPIKMSDGMQFNWKRIEKRLKAMQNSPDKVFEQPI